MTGKETETKKLSELWKKQDKEALARLSGTNDGRAFLHRLIVECGIFEPICESDISKAAYLEGRRSVGLWILNELEASEENSGAKMLADIIIRQNSKKKSMEVLMNGGGNKQSGRDSSGS